MKILLYCLVWLFMTIFLSIPISYFFQDEPLKIMGIYDYIAYFPNTIFVASLYGSIDIYFHTIAVMFILGAIAIIFFADHNKNRI